MRREYNLVYKLLVLIPDGYVLTYGQIAKFLKIKSPRFVGKILHNNPEPFDIPCHKVVFANGSLAPAYAFGGVDKQKELLEKEGIEVEDNRVDLSKYQYELGQKEKNKLGLT